jgi:hypothetical protein
MMTNKSDAIVQLMDAYIASLSERLQVVLNGSHSPGKILSATQESPQGVFGFVSFHPHSNPEEEAIDAALLFKQSGGTAKIAADICWSDGDLITDFGEYEIIYASAEELSQNFKIVCARIDEELYQRMSELIKSDLRPKYRSS